VEGEEGEGGAQVVGSGRAGGVEGRRAEMGGQEGGGGKTAGRKWVGKR
jgi:hypothetical protein